MGSEWVGVVGGLVGGVVGVSGSVFAQWLGDKNRGKLAREQWAEERRVRYRDERKAAYERFVIALRELLDSLAGAPQLGIDSAEPGQPIDKIRPGAHNETIVEAVDALEPILGELQLIGSGKVRDMAEQMVRDISFLRLNTALPSLETEGNVRTYLDWFTAISNRGDGLLKAAVLDLD